MPAWVFLAGGATAITLYAAGPPALGTALSTLVALGSIAATLTGLLRNEGPGRREPWWLILTAEACFFGAAVLRAVVPGAAATPPGNAAVIPDALTVPGYVLLALAFFRMLRARRAGQDVPARADAILIGINATLAAWAFLIAPSFDSSRLPPVPRAAAAFFPMVDVLIAVILAELIIAEGSRRPSMWFLGLSGAAMFLGDTLYALRELGHVVAGSQVAFDCLFLGGYVVMGAAALHPSMRTLTEPQQVTARSLGFVRIAGVAAVLVAPTVATLVFPPPTLWNEVGRIVLSVVLTVVIVGRIVRATNSQAAAEFAARRRATHDSLTDLPNRELLTETIERWSARAEAEGQEISLLFLDLDRFKLVNDGWGHAVGDELLCAVAARLSAVVREDDLVCRIGGDEFVIAFASPSHTRLAESLARRLLEEFVRPFRLSIGDVTITPSIGITRSEGAAGALALMRDADTAMYKAKVAGRNGYALFDESLHDQVHRRAQLEQALRGALERHELSVYYQPIVDLATGQLAGFEALMRWNHPRLGTVSPLDFIPIAEDTGLIVHSGAWLLEEAVEQLAQWNRHRPEGTPALHMSVNISSRQLRDMSLVEVVARVLARTGLPPDEVWLEITESGMMEEPESAASILRALRALGVILSVDDFGTGYSSLSYLKRFPIDILKIDRSFVAGVGADADDEAIVRTTVAMAHALGHRVVAEGVETAVQRDWLQTLGCDLAQGWLYGQPRAASAYNGGPAGWLALPGGTLTGVGEPSP
ncbi:MAG TPA: EAL domain-containing protein [Rugosimonospora sp.]|nr:EAL domain-containing protein [Rugosimonospora sp.]